MWTRSLLKSNAKQALPRAVLAQRGTVPTSFPVGHWLFFPPPYGAIPRNVFPTERYDERPSVAGQRRRWIHQRQ